MTDDGINPDDPPPASDPRCTCGGTGREQECEADCARWRERNDDERDNVL